jgi:DNA-binding PadR family transcriptional regulator
LREAAAAEIDNVIILITITVIMLVDPSHYLPMKPVAFHILLSLADGERHGYAITQEIANRTSTPIRVEPGNLYRFLRELLDSKLVEETDRLDGQERRRYYRLTTLGRKVAAAETTRLTELVAEARSKKWLRGRT